MRKPKAEELNDLAGRPGKRPPREGIPQPNKERPTCPNHLLHESRTEWYRIVPLLDAVKLISLSDRALLAEYCLAVERSIQASHSIAMDGLIVKDWRGNKRANPACKIASEAAATILRIAAHFGLSPQARTAMGYRPVASSSEQKEEDEFFGAVAVNVTGVGRVQ